MGGVGCGGGGGTAIFMLTPGVRSYSHMIKVQLGGLDKHWSQITGILARIAVVNVAEIQVLLSECSENIF